MLAVKKGYIPQSVTVFDINQKTLFFPFQLFEHVDTSQFHAHFADVLLFGLKGFFVENWSLFLLVASNFTHVLYADFQIIDSP